MTAEIIAPPLPPVAPEASEQSSNLPLIEYDPALTELADVEVDAHYFANLMRENGMNDADIVGTTYYVSSDSVVKPGKTPDDAIVTLGYYSPPQNQIKINIGSVQHTVDYTDGIKPLEPDRYDAYASLLASENGVHETGHRIAAIAKSVSFEDHLAYYDPLVRRRLGTRVVSRVLRMSRNPMHHEIADNLRKVEVAKAISKRTHEHYIDSPGERIARQLEDEAGKTFETENYYPIRVKFKSHPSHSEAATQ